MVTWPVPNYAHMQEPTSSPEPYKFREHLCLSHRFVRLIELQIIENDENVNLNCQIK